MLDQLKRLVESIEKDAQELNNITEKVTKIEVKRIEEVVKIARKGIKFKKIYKTARLYGTKGTNYRDDDYEYFEGIKGIRVDIETIKENTYDSGSDYTVRELFLLSDGTFKAFERVAETSRWEGSTDIHDRYEYEDTDIMDFDTDEIILNVMDKLHERLKSLGNRTKAQKERLEKISKMKI